MNEALHDPTVGGYFEKVTIEPAIEKVLGSANAAPDATPAQSSSFWRWFKWGAAALFLGVCWLLYLGYQKHTQDVQAIQTPSSGSPEIGASPSAKAASKGKKSAPKNEANGATNTPASDGFYGLKPSEKASNKPVVKESLTTEFELSEPVQSGIRPPSPPSPPSLP